MSVQQEEILALSAIYEPPTFEIINSSDGFQIEGIFRVFPELTAPLQIAATLDGLVCLLHLENFILYRCFITNNWVINVTSVYL